MWTYEEAFAHLESRKTAGIRPGLSRIKKALALLGDPQRNLRVVHVAGTNGKGSTGRMIQSILTAAGLRCGRYESPAVTGLRDTITLDGEAISEETFASLAERIAALEMGEEGLTEFEFVTVLAFLYFSEEKTAVCVVECGLGGLEDATNVIDPPLAAVLTPVALDHMAILGSTVEEVATHKAGIIKAPCGVIVAPGQPDEAFAVILKAAADQGLTLRMPGAASAHILEEDWGRLRFSWDGEEYLLPLTGAFQVNNALTAIETIRFLRTKGLPVGEEAIRTGLEKAFLPCRQEAISLSPLVVLDGGHNPHGMAALADTLGRLSPRKGWTAVVGMLADKDVDACMALLGPCLDRAICCTPANPRALPAETLASKLGAYCREVYASPDPVDALASAREKAADGPLLIAGSFFLCAQLRPLL